MGSHAEIKTTYGICNSPPFYPIQKNVSEAGVDFKRMVRHDLNLPPSFGTPIPTQTQKSVQDLLNGLGWEDGGAGRHLPVSVHFVDLKDEPFVSAIECYPHG